MRPVSAARLSPRPPQLHEEGRRRRGRAGLSRVAAMKIALVIEKFSPAGGAERACANLARGLLARGHEIHVFASRIEPLAGVVGHALTADSHASFASASRDALSRETFDIVQSFTRTPRQDVLRLGGGIHKEYLARTDVVYSAIGRW